MKHLFTATISALFITLFASCGMNVLKGSGEKGTEIPSVEAFNALDIEVSSEIKISILEGGANGIEFSGYENIIKHIKTEVKNGTLRIYYDLDNTWTIDDEVAIRISMPELKSMSISGAPDAEIHGIIAGDEFKMDVSGASSISIEQMNVDRFLADLSGASVLEINGGTARFAKYELSGAGKIKAYQLQTEETQASISGVGKSEVYATKKLKAEISGTGAIKYKGNPTITKHVSGIGSVSASD